MFFPNSVSSNAKKHNNAINIMHTNTYWIFGYKFLRTSTAKYTEYVTFVFIMYLSYLGLHFIINRSQQNYIQYVFLIFTTRCSYNSVGKLGKVGNTLYRIERENAKFSPNTYWKFGGSPSPYTAHFIQYSMA